MVCPQFKMATEEIVAEVSNEGHYSKEFSPCHTISSFSVSLNIVFLPVYFLGGSFPILG